MKSQTEGKKDIKHMTTLQDRIIKDFNNKFNKLVGGEGSCGSWAGIKSKKDWEAKYDLGDIEQFLIQSIKEVQEETRKEIFDNLPKVIEPPEDIEKFKEKRQAFLAGQINMLMRLNDLSLSITNKEK